MPTFNERGAPTFRKYVAQESIVRRNWSKTFQSFWFHSTVFGLKQQHKFPNIRVFLALGDALVVTFNQMRAPTSRKYIAEQGILVLNWSKTFLTFWLRSCVFALEKQPKNLNFKGFFTATRPFGGYFHWNACTYFQEICSWTRYSDVKFIKDISKFLVTFLCFCFRNTT